jgi:hypothetical protein
MIDTNLLRLRWKIQIKCILTALFGVTCILWAIVFFLLVPLNFYAEPVTSLLQRDMGIVVFATILLMLGIGSCIRSFVYMIEER